MGAYNDATFPPHGEWDARLTQLACPALVPVKTVHENPWFSVRNRGGYFTVEYQHGQVVVLPVVNNDSVVMVRVKRPVIGDMTLELPAGAIEEGEDPVDGARRELAEESGIAIRDLSRYVPMPPVAVFPTRMPQLGYVFRVDISEQEFETRRAHDDEIHCVERVPLHRVLEMMRTGEIYVAVPLAVLGIYLSTRMIHENT